MKIKGFIILASAIVLFAASTAGAATLPSGEQLLGGALYFDENLSINKNQSCASCHFPTAGFADPDSNIPVSQGSILTKFGSRNSPSAAYAAFSPGFGFNSDEGLYMGGQFWDGRAFNVTEQDKGPAINPVEMAMPNKAAVVARMAKNPAYVIAFYVLYHIDITNPAFADTAYDLMAQAMSEFERTSLFNQFNSKYDYFLKGRASLTAKEARGLARYNGKANCSACHPSEIAEDGTPPLFTDFSYDNLGIPVNPAIAKLNNVKKMPVDYGLGRNPTVIAEAKGPIETRDGKPLATDQMGQFKVMSLRNIAKTAPYGHNGYFKTLKEIVHFYNTPIGDFTPEVPETVNGEELHNLGLSSAEEDDIVAFLGTLTDGYKPASPWGVVPVPPIPQMP